MESHINRQIYQSFCEHAISRNMWKCYLGPHQPLSVDFDDLFISIRSLITIFAKEKQRHYDAKARPPAGRFERVDRLLFLVCCVRKCRICEERLLYLKTLKPHITV